MSSSINSTLYLNEDQLIIKNIKPLYPESLAPLNSMTETQTRCHLERCRLGKLTQSLDSPIFFIAQTEVLALCNIFTTSSISDAFLGSFNSGSHFSSTSFSAILKKNIYIVPGAGGTLTKKISSHRRFQYPSLLSYCFRVTSLLRSENSVTFIFY